MQACEIRILEEGLHLNTLLIHAVEANIVAHTLDERSLKILNVFLHKGNVFVKKLFLESFIGRANDCYFAGAHNGKEVSETVVGWNHGLASEIQVTLRLDLNTPYRT